MWFQLKFFFFALLIWPISTEDNSQSERLKQLPLTKLEDPPRPSSYLNSRLTKNIPHQINLLNQITEYVSEWNPQFLSSDATSPYYFSKLSNSSDDPNLLAYLQAVESNETLSSPFLNILPESCRSLLPLFSIFQCRQYFESTDEPFFHNVELLIGPGQIEFSLEQPSNPYSQFFCSLYGSPQILLTNSNSENNLANTEFYLTNLTPGDCLFIPSDWANSIQLNNSISLVFTIKQFVKESDDDILLCSKIERTTLNDITFSVEDSLSFDNLTLLIYFYEILDPPLFDREHNPESFLYYFQNDKNISELIIKWTPELTKLVEEDLFQEIDIDHDGIFNINDYSAITRSILKRLEQTIPEIFTQIRHTFLEQYQSLNAMIKFIVEQSSKHGLSQYDRDSLIELFENLPEPFRKRLEQSNVNIQEVLMKLRNPKPNQRTDL